VWPNVTVYALTALLCVEVVGVHKFLHCIIQRKDVRKDIHKTYLFLIMIIILVFSIYVTDVLHNFAFNKNICVPPELRD
jgi:hypothetical protein